MVNKKLESKFGTPCCDSQPLGTGTEAASRPAKSSSISGGKFTGGCSMYGTEGVGSTKGSGGKRQHGDRGHSNISAPSP